MPDSPSIFIPKDEAKRATGLIRQKTGKTVRDGVEIILRSDLLAETEQPVGPDAVDAGEILKEGLAFLANCPFEALDINLSSQTIDVRKSYKKLALKYHPDKNPATTPLFQAIQTAHEKLTCAENRKMEEEKLRAAAAAAAAAATRPTAPPPAGPPQRPASAAPGCGAASGPDRSPEAGPSSGVHQQSQQTNSRGPQHADKLKEEIARQKAAAAEKSRAEEARYAGMTGEEKERAQHRDRERKAAEERTAARRAKTGYAAYSSAGREGGERWGAQGGSRSPPVSASTQHTHDSSGESARGSRKDGDEDRPPQQESSKPSSREASQASERKGEERERGAAARRRKEKKREHTFSLPIPAGFKGTAMDSSTAQLEWQILLPLLPPQSTKEAALLGAMKTELSWREVMQYVKADGEVYHSSGQEWNSGGVLLSGEKVLKKNLLPGHKYEFRVRFVVPQNTSSTFGNNKGDMKGGWSETVSLMLPRKPAGTSNVSTGLDNQTFVAARKNGTGHSNGLTRNASAAAQEFPDGGTRAHNVGSMKGRPAGWGGSAVTDSSASLYGRHFGSATSLPEEVVEEDDIVPDQWVEDGSDSDDDDSPAKRNPLRRDRPSRHPQHGDHAPAENSAEEEKHTKWYQLMPPDSHVGTGKYKHPVRVSRQDDASVVGYVSTANKVKAKMKTADWMMVQVHWTTAAAALNGNTSGEESPVLPYGWMKRNEWNHRLQREHTLLRHIPESYKEMKTFNHHHVSTAIPEEDEADDSHTPLAVQQNQFSRRDWQEKTKDMRTQHNAAKRTADNEFLYSTSAHSASGNIDIWYEQVDEGGYLYYYNAATGESRWEPPEWVEEHDEVSGARYFIQLNRQTGNTLKSTWSRPKMFARLVRQPQADGS